MKRAVLVLVLMLCPSVALAVPATGAEPSPAAANAPAWIMKNHDEKPDPPPNPPSSGSRLRGVLAAFMVFTLIGFAVWTKTKKKQLTAKNPAAYVKVSDSVKVGDKAHLVVATIGDRTVVLGVTEHGIRRIMDVGQPRKEPAPKKAVLALKAQVAGEDADEKESLGSKSSSVMLAAASIKTRFQSLLQRAKGPTLRDEEESAANDHPTKQAKESDVDDDTHWAEKLDIELRAAQNEAAELDTASPPGAVSAPMLRVANDTSDRVRMRLSGSHAIDPLGLEEQVQGLLTARARRN